MGTDTDRIQKSIVLRASLERRQQPGAFVEANYRRRDLQIPQALGAGAAGPLSLLLVGRVHGTIAR